MHGGSFARWVQATAPANIAFVKYWGKGASGEPLNPSIAMTLQGFETCTRARVQAQEGHCLQVDGKVRPLEDHWAQKAYNHLDRIGRLLGKHSGLAVESRNSFPSDCGLASSASAMAALTLAALGAWLGASNWDELERLGWNRKKVALLAAQGSGSAARSFHKGFVRWDGLDVQAVADQWPLADTVLLVDQRPKHISSSVAHRRVSSSILWPLRNAGMHEVLVGVERALVNKDLEQLGMWLEKEALEMHMVSWVAEEPVQYVSEKTIEVWSSLRQWRQKAGIKAFVTLDAGPNLHVISTLEDRHKVVAWAQGQWPGMPILKAQSGEGATLQDC